MNCRRRAASVQHHDSPGDSPGAKHGTAVDRFAIIHTGNEKDEYGNDDEDFTAVAAIRYLHCAGAFSIWQEQVVFQHPCLPVSTKMHVAKW